MCYEQRDSVVSRLCKERDELRQLLEKQFEAYKQAVEVVRCKDCKHYDKRSDFCEAIGFSCLPDNFCSYGERKDGEV